MQRQDTKRVPNHHELRNANCFWFNTLTAVNCEGFKQKKMKVDRHAGPETPRTLGVLQLSSCLRVGMQFPDIS